MASKGASNVSGLVPTHPVSGRDRLVSLDVFRGLTVASMIVVNTPGSVDFVYPPLTHAAWHGWTWADVIFPFFLFIAGVAITLSLPEPAALHAHRHSILARAVRRAVLLFVLGVLFENFPTYHLFTLRIPGVLQRIALCYLCVVLIFVSSGTRGQALITVGLLVLYWALLTLVPVPVHNFLDGALIAGAFLTSTKLGVITTALVILHEVPHELGDFAVLIYGGCSRPQALGYNVLSALTAILGGMCTYLFSVVVANLQAPLLAISAGGFLYIALADLLPELKEEQRFSASLLQFVLVLFGLVLVWAGTLLPT